LLGGEEIGERGVAIGFVVGTVAFCLEVVEETLGEMFFVFDQNDEGRGGFSHGSSRVFCLLH
jgi:hypothetical protein